MLKRYFSIWARPKYVGRQQAFVPGLASDLGSRLHLAMRLVAGEADVAAAEA